MNLNVGCGGNKYGSFRDLRCEVNCDVQKPLIKIDNFVRCDARFLPFKPDTFETAYAFNVLEHIINYKSALAELYRVSNITLIRFDKIYNLGNWWTLDHEYIQFGGTLIHFPSFLKIIRSIFWAFVRTRIIGRQFWRSLPILRKVRLLDSWNYYHITKREILDITPFKSNIQKSDSE